MTRMEKEIQELIIDSIKKGNCFGEDFYNEIINIYIKHKDLGNYLNSKVIIKETKENNIAQFLPGEKQIIMSLNGINNQLQTIQRDYSAAFDFDTLIKYVSLRITQYLLHELEHVDQEKIIREKDTTTLEGKLLKETNIDIDYVFEQAIAKATTVEEIHKYMDQRIALFQETYRRNYKIILRERLSQLRSIRQILETLKNLDLHQNVHTMFQSEMVDERLRGHELNGFYSVGPTLELIDILSESKLTDRETSEFYDENKVKAFVELSQKYSLDDRIEFGLPINSNEYQQIEAEKPKGLIRI